MSDDPAKIILGEGAISAFEQQRGLFRRRRRPKDAPPPILNCENCGTELRGHWCSKCGQPAIDYKRSFRHVIVDLLESFLNWDSKFFTTIGLLLTRPWRLTNAFLAGHRVRYLHPARLYLFASVVFFLVATFAIKQAKFAPIHLSPEDRAKIRTELQRQNVSPEIREKLEQALGGKPISPEKRVALEAQLKNPALPQEARDAIQERLDHGDLPPDARKQIESVMKDLPPEARAKVDQALKRTNDDRGFVWDEDDKDSDKPEKEKSEKKKKNDLTSQWWEQKAREKFGEHGSNIQLFLVTLLSNLPYMMLACIPLFALVLKILYVRKRIFYIDHLVYAFHIHSFAYLLILLNVVITVFLSRTLPGAVAGWIIAALWTTFAVQVFLSIRRVYRQGWIWSIVKFFVGGFAYLIVLVAALVATFVITIVLPS